MKGFKRVMKGVALFMAAAMAFTSMPSHVQAEETSGTVAITDADFLKADGKNLKTASGEIVNLRGTNAGGYLVQEFWMTPTAYSDNVTDQEGLMNKLTERFGEDKMYELVDVFEAAYWTEADFDNCAAMGMNCIRLPFWWRNLVDENGVFYGYEESAEQDIVSGNDVSGNDLADEASDTDPYAIAFERMDWFIQEAGERGLYVIVDFHGAPGSQNGSDHSGVDGGDDKKGASEFFFGENAAANQELFYDIWEVVAERYAGNPVVAAYDLLNEPFCTYRYNSGMSDNELHTMLWDIYDKAYDVIRSVDSDHVVIMEAVWDAGDLPNPAIYGWENVMYEYHNYNYDAIDDVDSQVASMQTKLNGIANADYNVPSYMGEFCYFNKIDAWDQGLELLTNAGMNWTTWTYKTVASYGNWGYYHHPESMNNGVNLETASYEEILECWQNVGTSQGTPNSALIEVASKWFQAEAQENTMGPKYSEIEAGTYYFVGDYSKRVLTNTGDENENIIGAVGKERADSNELKFELVRNDDNTVSLKSLANNKYISVNSEDKLFRANADSITDNEKFYMMQVSDATIALKSVATQLFSCVDENLTDYVEGGFPVVADRSSATGWELFDVYTLEGEWIGGKVDEGVSGWTKYESENPEVAEIVGGGISSQSFYSGGQAAGSLDVSSVAIEDVADDWSNIRYVIYDVTAEKAGTYQLVMTYNGLGEKKFLIKANDGDAVTVELPDSANWNDINYGCFTVDLQEGENKLYISGAVGGGWMDIDYIQIVNSPLTENADGSVRYEAENFTWQSAKSDAEVKEHQDFYSGSDNLNGVGGMCIPAEYTEGQNLLESGLAYTNFTIFAEEAGEYAIKLACNGNGADMQGVYQVNDEPSTNYDILNAGASWNTMCYPVFAVTLQKGFNQLVVSGPYDSWDNWMNFDYIDVSLLPGTISGWTRYEGEIEATLVNGGKLESQSFFSNGLAVADLARYDIPMDSIAEDWSNIPYAELKINAAQAGDYRVAIGYNGDDDKTFALKVNGGETQSISVPSTGNPAAWDAMHEKSLVITLAEGENTIWISGALGGGWMNIDYIDIANAPITVNENTGAERYEAEDFNCKSANNPSAEHQDFYSGAAHNNGVGGMGATDGGFTVGSDILGTNLNYIDYSIFVDKAGEYDITVAGNGNGADMTCVYQVNGAASESFVLLNAGYSWDHMVYNTIRVDLNEGYNQLILAGTFSGDWLNYDYIDVVAVDAESDDTTGEDDTTEGGDDSDTGSDDTTGEDDTTEGGDDSDTGSDDTTGGDDTTEGGDDSDTGSDDTTGGDDTTEGGDDSDTGSDDGTGEEPEDNKKPDKDKNPGNDKKPDKDKNPGNDKKPDKDKKPGNNKKPGSGKNPGKENKPETGNNGNTGNQTNTGSQSNTGNHDNQANNGNTGNPHVVNVVEAVVEENVAVAETVSVVEEVEEVESAEVVEVAEAVNDSDDEVTEEVAEETVELKAEAEESNEEAEILDEEVPASAAVTEKNHNVYLWILLALVLGAVVIVGTRVYFLKKENE